MLNAPPGFLKGTEHGRQESNVDIEAADHRNALYPFVLHCILCESIYYRQQEREMCTFITKYRRKRKS